MVKRPSICGKGKIHIPEDDCSECMVEVEKLRREMEECCDEVKDTLEDHDTRITTNTNNITNLLPRVSRNETSISNHETRITTLEDCCDEVNHEIQTINNNFNNYYTKTETYTQQQVDDLISQIEGSSFLEVNELPAVGDPSIIYLLPAQGGGKEQWVYSNGQWINIGSTAIDLSEYVKIADVVDMIHPIGDTVIRTDNVNPGTLYTGTTWQKISEGRMLIGANSTHTLGSTGGEARVSYTPAGTVGNTTLNAAQSGLPAHTHAFTNPTIGGGAHTHPTASGGDYRYMVSNVAIGEILVNYAANGNRKVAGIANMASTDDFAASAKVTGSATPSMTASGGAVGAVTGGAKAATSAHNHGFTGTAASINNMSPYLAVNIWLRTA